MDEACVDPFYETVLAAFGAEEEVCRKALDNLNQMFIARQYSAGELHSRFDDEIYPT